MRIRSEFPHNVKEIEHTLIEVDDGATLAARVWMPESAERMPVPAILELIPYRKRDFTAQRDARNHHWFAGHGYACVRVDMRGSGDSEGVLTDEYLKREQDDGIEVIRWIREQPWCDGKVGMFGISWGGFNGLQIAARQPEGLDAVVSVASTDDRYADDVHYMGGCLLGDNLSWASTMFAYNASPPDPELVGDKWKDMWLERMANSGLWVANWLNHQTRDDFWKHGSICEDFDAVKTPVFAVSGWADGYSNAVFRLVKSLSCPSLGLIGPWSHKYPHQGIPGPAIGFLQECLRWWDHWLKGRDTGIMDEPKLRAWVQDSIPPSSRYKERPGHWCGEPSWPSPNVKEKEWHLLPGARLGPEPAEPGGTDSAERLWVQSPLSVGQFSGKWCSYASAPDLPADQREEDGGALVWQSDRLMESLQLLGAARVCLRLSCNQTTGMIAVRLSDVADDGKATRVTYGLLNLTHHKSHEHPNRLDPSKEYDVVCPLNYCGHRFLKGHSLRISISTSLWPLAWTPPHPTRITIDPANSSVCLPIHDHPEVDCLVDFDEPEQAPDLPQTNIKTGEHHWWLERDLGSDTSKMKVLNDEGTVRLDDIDLTTARTAYEEYTVADDDFESPSGETTHERSWTRGDWRAALRARTRMTCDSQYFYITADLDAWLNGDRIFCRSWNERIVRNLV